MVDVKQSVRKFISDNFIMGTSGPQFSDSDSFLSRRIIDSTGFLELVSYLEDTFAIKVEDDEMTPENLDSLNALEAYVQRKGGG
jgi:acyl carrier protein